MYPKFVDISSAFSGTGTLLIDFPSLTDYIEGRFSSQQNESDVLTFLLANISLTFPDITIINGPSCSFMQNQYSKIRYHDSLDTLLQDERIAVCLLSIAKEKLISRLHKNKVYVAALEYMEFRLPSVYAFVFMPSLSYDFSKISREYLESSNGTSVLEARLEKLSINENNIQTKDNKTSEEKNKESSVKYTKKNYENSTSSIIDLTSKCVVEENRNIQRYTQHLKTAADSLYSGTLTVASFHSSIKSHKKISAKQKQIMEQNEKRLADLQRTKDNEYVKSVFMRYRDGNEEEKRRSVCSTIMYNDFVKLKILLLRIEYFTGLWELEQRKEVIDEGMLVPLYLTCLEVIELLLSQGNIGGELSYVMQKMIDVGFTSTVLEILEKNNIKYDTKDSKKSNMVVLNIKEGASSSPNDIDLYFQLKFAGDKLKRTLGSQKDERVLFTPDYWQVQLLNLVDNNASSVVVAPTSSGKTFICFYAIEKILRSSDTDVVIFCLPTKALVNQVMADVYARFNTKTYKNNKVLQGALLKDYVIEPFNCQVLITTPFMLECLLSTLIMQEEEDNKTGVMRKKNKVDMQVKDLKRTKSATKQKNILSKNLSEALRGSGLKLSMIKYIIIDEVHKIGSEEMGISIERVVHMAPCPLLLLSATLGNLQSFYDWMVSVENDRGRKCELVVHNERYCELKPFIFCSKKNDNNVNDIGANKNEESSNAILVPINPLFSFSYSHIKQSGFSSDISFLPDELLNLYYAIYYVTKGNKSMRKTIKTFRPANFFKSNIITKRDVKAYETFICSTLKDLIAKNAITEDELKAVYGILVDETNKAFEIEEHIIDSFSKTNVESNKHEDIENNINLNNRECNNSTDSGSTKNINLMNDTLNQKPKAYNIRTDTTYLEENITDLILELKSKDLLPCIIFNTDRNVCNALAKRLYDDLEKMERSETSNKNEQKRKEKFLKEAKRNRDKERKGETFIEDTLIEEENLDLLIEEKKNIKYCLFSSLYRKSTHEIDEAAKSLKKKNVDAKAIDMIYRGIGIHHNGMNKKYRVTVETYFRSKHLTTVFSTETLSLGINMPCRSVVFAGDTLDLNLINFKQMAGRAGRRGFDTLGNIIFFGLNKSRVQNLMLSGMGEIAAQNGMVAGSLMRGKGVADSFVKHNLYSLIYNKKETEIVEDKNECNKIKMGDFNKYNLAEFFTVEEKRKKLMQLQLETLQKFSFMEGNDITILSDLYFSNQESDPVVFPFAVMLSQIFTEDVAFDQREFMNIISHFFEVKYTLDKKHALEPLKGKVANFYAEIMQEYNENIRMFFGEELNNLKLQKNDSLFIMDSFMRLASTTASKNNYIMEFYDHGKLESIRKYNGFELGEIFISFDIINSVLESLISFFDKCKMERLKKSVRAVHESFWYKFKKIHA